MTTPPETPAEGVSVPKAPEFATVQRNGYHKQQVEEYVGKLWDRIRELEHQVWQWSKGPAEKVAVETAESPQAQHLVQDLLQMALDEVTQQRTAAAEQAAKILADAKATADQAIADAKAEAASMLSGARQQSETVVTGARAEADRIMSQATAKASAVSEVADQRLAKITAVHEKTIARLQEIHTVTGGWASAEEQRGSMTDEVNRVLQASQVPAIQVAPQVQAQAPAQLTASAEG